MDSLKNFRNLVSEMHKNTEELEAKLGVASQQIVIVHNALNLFGSALVESSTLLMEMGNTLGGLIGIADSLKERYGE